MVSVSFQLTALLTALYKNKNILIIKKSKSSNSKIITRKKINIRFLKNLLLIRIVLILLILFVYDKK